MSLQEMGTRTLEMVAVALSEEYGVRVVSSGRRAHASHSLDGSRPVITIPAVDTDDEDYLTLIRGYIDHEVGHVRFTRQPKLTAAIDAVPQAIGAMKILSHLYEDLFVERRMGECFPGCGRNLRKLASLIYNKQRERPLDAAQILAEAAESAQGARSLAYHVWNAVAQYILYRVRQEAARDLRALLPDYREPVELLAPGLAERLEPILTRLPAEGVSTEANAALAAETLAAIREYFRQDWGEELKTELPETLPQLDWVLKFGGSAGDTVDIGRAAVNRVAGIMQAAEKLGYSNVVITPREFGGYFWKERLMRLSEREQKEALQASALLDAQVQSLLQTFVLNRDGSARIGKLDTNLLHRLAVGDSRIFRRNVEKRGVNTEVVIAVDMSGSMEKNDKALMASKALYAVIYSLRKIPGLRSSVIGFFDESVLQILRPTDRVTPRMKITAAGGTLCGEALRFAMQNFSRSPDSRKIVLMLTDGDTANSVYFEQIIRRARRAGVEFLGIGIQDDDIGKYLQPEECCVIDDLRQLAPEMFRLLQGKLVGAV